MIMFIILDSVYNILGYDHTLGEIINNDRILKVDSFLWALIMKDMLML